jgi:hypothetical protein
MTTTSISSSSVKPRERRLMEADVRNDTLGRVTITPDCQQAMCPRNAHFAPDFTSFRSQKGGLAGNQLHRYAKKCGACRTRLL